MYLVCFDDVDLCARRTFGTCSFMLALQYPIYLSLNLAVCKTCLHAFFQLYYQLLYILTQNNTFLAINGLKIMLCKWFYNWNDVQLLESRQAEDFSRFTIINTTHVEILSQRCQKIKRLVMLV